MLANFLEMMERNDYVVLDTETTGLHRGEICQIAIINPSGETLLNSYVKTVNPIPLAAQQIHGISDAMVADAPTWNTVSEQVREIVAGRDVVVYNATYDRKMMHQSAEAAGMPKTDWKTFSWWYCAMLSYAEYRGDWNDYYGNYRWHKLSNAARQCGVKVENAHDALGDCLMTLGVMKYMANENATPEVDGIPW